MTKAEPSTEKPSVVHLLHRAGQYADELFAQNSVSENLTPRQYVLMRAIARSEQPSQTTLVKMTGIDRSTTADIMRRLVAEGLVHRRHPQGDRRSYNVRLTDQGLSVLKAAMPVARKTDEQLLATLPTAQRHVFLRQLARIVDDLAQATGGVQDRPGRG